jgi:hypothetical protein
MGGQGREGRDIRRETMMIVQSSLPICLGYNILLTNITSQLTPISEGSWVDPFLYVVA